MEMQGAKKTFLLQGSHPHPFVLQKEEDRYPWVAGISITGTKGGGINKNDSAGGLR
jgi:hypothetical protein